MNRGFGAVANDGTDTHLVAIFGLRRFQFDLAAGKKRLIG